MPFPQPVHERVEAQPEGALGPRRVGVLGIERLPQGGELGGDRGLREQVARRDDVERRAEHVRLDGAHDGDGVAGGPAAREQRSDDGLVHLERGTVADRRGRQQRDHVRVRREGGQVRAGPRVERDIPSVLAERRDVDALDDAGAHGLDELGAAADVVVERRDLAVDARRERAHREGLAALLVDEVERGADELFALEPSHECPPGSSVAVIGSVT